MKHKNILPTIIILYKLCLIYTAKDLFLILEGKKHIMQKNHFMKIKIIVKNKILLVISLFFCFLIISRGITFAVSYNLYNPLSYTIIYRTELINVSEKNISKAIIYIPLIEDNFPNQKVEILDIIPSGYKIFKSAESGTNISYAVKNIKPHEKMTFTIRCKVKVYDLFYNVDFNEFSQVTYDKNSVFLKPQEYIESDSKLIKHVSFKIAGTEKNPYLVSLRLYDYLRENINFDFRAGLYGAESSLRNKLVGCSDAAGLYTALCRSYGIPARYCAGFYLGNIDMDDNKWHTITDTHAWSEVNISYDNWLPVDPTQGRFNQMRRFQCFAQESNDYIALWKDKVEPVAIDCKDKKRNKDLYIDFYTKIKKEDIETKPTCPRIFKLNPPPCPLKNKSYGVESSNCDNHIGYIYLQTHNYKEAFRCFAQSIAFNPKNTAAYENMINLFCYLRMYDESLIWIQAAKKELPDSAQLYAQEGEIYLVKKQIDKSISCLKKAVALNDRKGYYFYLLALVYLNKGPEYKNMAENCLRSTLKLGVSEDIKNNIKAIQKQVFIK